MYHLMYYAVWHKEGCKIDEAESLEIAANMERFWYSSVISFKSSNNGICSGMYSDTPHNYQ